MKHQQSSYQTDRKAGKYLTQCMMSQNNPCGTQYTCNQDKQAQPCYGIITEQRTERDQSSAHSTYSCQMTETTRDARIMPVIYQGIFSLRIISRQNTYEMIVSRIGT